MIGKKDIEILRLKTRLAECKQVWETTSYESQKTVAKNTLDSLQEQFKNLTGDYAKDYLVNENEGKHKWEVNSAKRSDGYVFNVEDTYMDLNGSEYTIKRMYIADNGNLMAEAVEGGSIDLWNAKVDKFVGESVEMKSAELVDGTIYKIYDKNDDGKLYKSAARFDGLDGDKGNKFALINHPQESFIWIKPEDLENFIFIVTSYHKK